MAQVSMTVRMDSQLKQTFDKLCSEFGMSANTAMNIFANAVVMTRSIPFEIKAVTSTYKEALEYIAGVICTDMCVSLDKAEEE